MSHRIYSAEVLFETSIDSCGGSYLVIYGKHVNGYFCAIPNWSIGCELAEPSDIAYNMYKFMQNCELCSAVAEDLAHGILDVYDQFYTKKGKRRKPA